MIRKSRAWLDHIAAMNPEVVTASGYIEAKKNAPASESLLVGADSPAQAAFPE